MTSKLPMDLQAILWSTDVSKIDVEKDKIYIIHQLLAYGSFDEYLWLFKIYGRETVRKTFVRYPEKDYYSKEYFNFIKLRILGINEEVDEKYYCKEYPRIMKQYIPPKISRYNGIFKKKTLVQ